MDQRQEKSAPKLTFLHRTDKLAARLGIGVKEVAERIGISTGTLFAGRRGDANVKAKTWARLEEAELECKPVQSAKSSAQVKQPKRNQEKKSAGLDDVLVRLDALEVHMRLLEKLLDALLPSASTRRKKPLKPRQTITPHGQLFHAEERGFEHDD